MHKSKDALDYFTVKNGINWTYFSYQEVGFRKIIADPEPNSP